MELDIPWCGIYKTCLGWTFCSPNYTLKGMGQAPLRVDSLWPRQPQPILTRSIGLSASWTTWAYAVANYPRVCIAWVLSPLNALLLNRDSTFASPTLIHTHCESIRSLFDILTVHVENCSASTKRLPIFDFARRWQMRCTGGGVIEGLYHRNRCPIKSPYSLAYLPLLEKRQLFCVLAI